MDNNKLITFNDSVQRTIIAEKLTETDTTITVKNPVVINVQPQMNQTGQQTGQMVLQLLPIFFKEFLGDKNASINYKYNRDQITEIDFEGGFDFRLYSQYEQIFNPSAVVAPQGVGQVQPAPVQVAPGLAPLQLFKE